MDDRRGFALAAALMVLALLSVLGAAAIQSMSIETRISAHDRDARVALYVAETALSEARYYASRGWGKIRPAGTATVEVETPLPPGLAWNTDRYRGFTLVDRGGAPFAILSHTDAATPPVLTLSVPGAPPQPGRFTLVRRIPASAVWSDPDLIVDDDPTNPWSASSPVNGWAGWTLWNADGDAFRVRASSTGPASAGPGLSVRLTVTLPAGVPTSGAGPYELSLNPWLRDAAAGATLPGDDQPTEPGWGRTIYLDAGHHDVLGSAAIETVEEDPGVYRLTATGRSGPSLRQVTLRVLLAGRADQRSRDWAVVAP
ncbi:MAG: pilus assembly PilX N-terminal domain-containing protein [Deltaproteobacteria bacterium]|nr:pilus assembly PilX N-terminal domain-containing protein [Deltaproteobacteria bacterium]